MAGERAKEVAARQKAEAAALKEKKKHSDDPKDWGTMRQVRETLKITLKGDPKAKWWLLASLLGPIAIGVVVGLITTHWLYFPIFGLMVGLTVAMFALVKLSKDVMYKRYDGQPGSAQVAIGTLDKKKWSSEWAIAINRQQDCVHRVIGRAGIVLVGDGDQQRVKALLATERKRHEQVAYDVPVTTISVGQGDEQVKLTKAANAVKKLPKPLSKSEVAQLQSRIKALDNVRGRMPIPRGPIPNMKGAHKAMRGR